MSEPPQRKSGDRAPRRDERGGTTELAPGAPARRCRQRRRDRRATATAPREEATAPTTTHREREPPNTTHPAERASHRHGSAAAQRHAAASAEVRPNRRPCGTPPLVRLLDQAGAKAASAPARRRRQRRRERDATATAPREEPTAPTTTRREREPPSTTRRDGRVSQRHRRAAAERHATGSAAARPSRLRPSATFPRARRHDQAGAMSAVRRRPPSERRRPRQRPHAESASCRASAESEPPLRNRSGRTSRRRDCGGTFQPSLGAPARRHK